MIVQKEPLSTQAVQDYERHFSRTLLVWQNIFWESFQEMAGGPERGRIAVLVEMIKALRKDLIPCDTHIKGPTALWEEIDKQVDEFHKKFVHVMPNREEAHRKIRILEELLREARLCPRDAQSVESDPSAYSHGSPGAPESSRSSN